MKASGKRIDTLILLVNASPGFQDVVVKAAVIDELQEIKRLAGMQPLRRRRLLGLLHLSRCLETSLRSVVQSKAITLPLDRRNMGGYLNALVNASPSLLPRIVKDDCIKRVANLRNRIAHVAGEYPANDVLLDGAVQAAHGCLIIVLR